MLVDTDKLSTISAKAREDGISTVAVYKRINKGLYDVVPIKGQTLIVGDYKGDPQPKRGGKR